MAGRGWAVPAPKRFAKAGGSRRTLIAPQHLLCHTKYMATPPIDIASLSADERISLIDALWESLSHSPDTVALSAEQEAELDKRLDEIDRGEVSGESWEALRDHLREKVS